MLLKVSCKNLKKNNLIKIKNKPFWKLVIEDSLFSLIFIIISFGLDYFDIIDIFDDEEYNLIFIVLILLAFFTSSLLFMLFYKKFVLYCLNQLETRAHDKHQ